MLCPEVIKFPIPSYRADCMEGRSWCDIKKSTKMKENIKSIQMARLLSVIIPANERVVVDKIANDLESASCSLYLVKQIPLAEMVRDEFVEAFVKRGELHAISAKARLETDDCAAILPNGILLLSLNRDTYQRLKCSRDSISPSQEKYVVKIHLNSAIAKEQLREETLAFDMIFRWIPAVPSSLVSQSDLAVSDRSLQHYLQNTRSLSVGKLPSAGSKLVQLQDMAIPLLTNIEQGKANSDETLFCTSDELMEYIGLLVLNCDFKSYEFCSSYSMNGCTRQLDSTWLLHQQGIFSLSDVERTIDQLDQFIDEQRLVDQYAVPWVALHVQGFPNVPQSSAGTKGSGIVYDNDNAFTIVIGGQGEVIWRKLVGCNGKGPVAPNHSFQ